MKSISNFITKAFDWLWLSSANPQQVGLSAKGVLTVITGSLIPLLGLFNVHVGNDMVNQVIDAVDISVTDVLIAVGAIGTLVGAVRKLVLTFTGGNQVLSNPQNPVPPANA